MNRRGFIQKSGLVVPALGSFTLIDKIYGNGLSSKGKHAFQLNYAPHLGMFKNSAGDDPIDQLNFMAEMGFTAFEDNGMKDRPLELQEKMAATLEKHDMMMGVFVAHKIWCPGRDAKHMLG